jgi:predicted ATPase
VLRTGSGHRVRATVGAAARSRRNARPEHLATELSLGAQQPDPSRQRLRLLHGLTTWVCTRAAANPQLVSIEDLHWCDENTLDFVARLARRIPSVPILLLVTYRPDELPAGVSDLLTELRRARSIHELRL